MTKKKTSVSAPAGGTGNGEDWVEMKKRNVMELNDDEAMADFLETEGPRVLQMHATWCAPCGKVAPILEGLAKEYRGNVTFGRVDIDESELAREMMEEFGIIGVPAILILGNGKGGFAVGSQTEAYYRKAIEKILEAN